ncbi:hypothetical protein [uncultured Empedobacter sp.]|mgnify:CR=1 FL=1|uniref:hypothetical protein n=1 Tax=uncultured Empedobacter sp. TaxID=410844 RepID=UPI0025E65A74|nr:hypothetical protein [uncultured Empedobacter sp.]
MKTVNNELQTIATIMNKNLTTTILTLHNLGFDFNKSVGEQDGEVDEKVSQMMLSSLIINEQEEITQQTVEETIEEEPEPHQSIKQDELERIQDDKYNKYKLYYDEEIENKMKMVRIKVDSDKIHHKKYKKGETQTKRDRLHWTIMHVSGFSVYDRDKFFENSDWSNEKSRELENNNTDEVRQLVDDYFECELENKDENLEKILEKYKYMMEQNFKINTDPKMR